MIKVALERHSKQGAPRQQFKAAVEEGRRVEI
jgi:hypothetical protein